MSKRKRPAKSKLPQPQQQVLSGGQISITQEVDYILKRAQANDARLVQLGTLILFSTATGDAWLLDTEDNLALCLAREGQKQRFTITETATNFGIEWNADYHIEGQAFVVANRSGQIRTILGYPTREIAQATHRR